MKKAYLVFGPESSGTRMITQYIALCAGAFGDWGHYQSLDRRDTFDFLHPEASIVWRRSLPHGGEWADIRYFTGFLERRGFDVVRIGTIRGPRDTIDSQIRRQHVRTTAQGVTNYTRAMEIVYAQARVIVDYEHFCSFPARRAEFLRKIGVAMPSVEPMEIRPLEKGEV